MMRMAHDAWFSPFKHSKSLDKLQNFAIYSITNIDRVSNLERWDPRHQLQPLNLQLAFEPDNRFSL